VDATKEIGSVRFTLESILKPWDFDPDKYAIEVRGEIVVARNDDAEETAGTMKLVIIKLADALLAGVHPHQVFDYSADLEGTYSDLFDTKGRFRRRFKIERKLHNLLFIDTVRLRVGLGSKRLFAQAVETASAVLAPNSVVIGYSDELNKYGLKWQHYGFVFAGKSGVMLRDNLDFPVEEMAIWTPPPDALEEVFKPKYPRLADD